MSKKDLKPVHPGEVLLEEFLLPMHLSQNRLALDIGMPPRRINEVDMSVAMISVIRKAHPDIVIASPENSMNSSNAS